MIRLSFSHNNCLLHWRRDLLIGHVSDLCSLLSISWRIRDLLRIRRLTRHGLRISGLTGHGLRIPRLWVHWLRRILGLGVLRHHKNTFSTTDY